MTMLTETGGVARTSAAPRRVVQAPVLVELRLERRDLVGLGPRGGGVEHDGVHDSRYHGA
jgi:hypothetical protein